MRFDYSESGVYYSFTSWRKDYRGSFGYSWDVGSVHFVRLNNYLTHATHWNGWNFPSVRGQGKTIVLNVHDYLLVRFNNSQMQVQKVDSTNGAIQPHIKGHADTKVSQPAPDMCKMQPAGVFLSSCSIVIGK